ncbi:cytosolic non-specific dipeptidase isoform X1 [Octopus sinensis]|uniref:Cytosolic non-specific dipeptidase isoform X1 n=2 Tax=Octopus sinensis TaxID=2607531 RepID=A0A6P7SJY6_9MOLL|nr:cytosolic non-specific dipeptidase isoform X1 [Octopus sinensis]
MEPVFKYIDDNADRFIKRLGTAVAIPSVSASVKLRPEVRRMVEWTKAEMDKLNIQTELLELGDQVLPSSGVLKLPPVIFGQLGNDPKKKTLLAYGHVDVQPANKSDGWDTDPFLLTEIDGKLYGRGTSDDKGPVLGWLNAIEAYQNQKIDLPLNLKFVFEAMEESDSDGLANLLMSKKDSFLKDIDFICISDNNWLSKNRPCLTYGLRGVCHFFVEVECSSKDLHSGVFGGSVHEAMSDLIFLMNSLVDVKGRILIPGIYDSVEPITSEEDSLYKDIDFDLEDLRKDIGCEKLLHSSKVELLQHNWRHPCLSLHGIEGAFSEPGAKTVIPRKVTGKFSIRIVPNQDPDEVQRLTKSYLENCHKTRGSPNKLRVTTSGSPAWISDYKHENYTAAKKACKKVYGVEPDMTREGGSVPVVFYMEKATSTNVLLLPMGACDDDPHSQNEKLDISKFIDGTKLFAAYINELGKLGK